MFATGTYYRSIAFSQHRASRAPLRGHFGEILCIAFSRDGGRPVSGGRDATVRLWDAVPVGSGHPHDMWAEDLGRRGTTDPQYHADAALDAEATEDWFAACFHLRWRADRAPQDEGLQKRLRNAERALAARKEAEKAPGASTVGSG